MINMIKTKRKGILTVSFEADFIDVNEKFYRALEEIQQSKETASINIEKPPIYQFKKHKSYGKANIANQNHPFTYKKERLR